MSAVGSPSRDRSISRENPVKQHGILVLGSGSSSGVPTAFELMYPDKVSIARRNVAMKSIGTDPRQNKNYRCNPSLILRFDDKNVVIDVGKTFREACIRWFPIHHISCIDSIILTHPHADAMMGLDDVRSLQGPAFPPMDVYLSEDCHKIVSRTFPYLMPASSTDGRLVASINWNNIEEYVPFEVCGLSIQPIPIMHGEDMKCMGFIFGRKQRVCYLSDISRMLPLTLDAIQQQSIDILIIDALYISDPHPFHFSMDQSIELAKIIRPQKVFFIGMTTEFDHDEVSASLVEISAEANIEFQLSYDGLFIPVDI